MEETAKIIKSIKVGKTNVAYIITNEGSEYLYEVGTVYIMNSQCSLCCNKTPSKGLKCRSGIGEPWLCDIVFQKLGYSRSDLKGYFKEYKSKSLMESRYLWKQFVNIRQIIK